MSDDLIRRRNGALQKKKLVHDQEVGVIEGNLPFPFLYLGHFLRIVFKWLLTIP